LELDITALVFRSGAGHVGDGNALCMQGFPKNIKLSDTVFLAWQLLLQSLRIGLIPVKSVGLLWSSSDTWVWTLTMGIARLQLN
jgi:hypothetical protein